MTKHTKLTHHTGPWPRSAAATADETNPKHLDGAEATWYEFQPKVLCPEPGSRTVLRAGGPLKRDFRILRSPGGVTQRVCMLLLGPVLDSFDNELRFYYPVAGDSERAKHPFEVRESPDGELLYRGTLDVVSDYLGFVIQEQFPETAFFRLDSRSGPRDSRLDPDGDSLDADN